MLGDRVTEGKFAEIRSDPPACDPATVDNAVRTQIEKRSAVHRNKPELDSSRRGQCGQRLIQCTGLDRESEHERCREGGGRIRLGGGKRTESGDAMAAMERLRGIRSPELGESVHGEARGPKIAGEGRDER